MSRDSFYAGRGRTWTLKADAAAVAPLLYQASGNEEKSKLFDMKLVLGQLLHSIIMNQFWDRKRFI